MVGGFLKVDVDAQDAMYAPVSRDSEGVFEVTMTFGEPFNGPGRHDMSLVLLDADRQPLSGHVQLHYLVDELKGPRESTRADRVGKAESEDGGADASAEREKLQVPLGSWAAFAGARVGLGAWPPPTPGRDGYAPRQACSPHGATNLELGHECSGHGKCVNLDDSSSEATGAGGFGGSDGLGVADEWGCICTGNWVGSSCNVSLDSAQEFLPPVLPHQDEHRRALSATLLNGSQDVLRQLARQHDARNCRKDKALAFDYNDQGLAAVVSDASVQLTWAFRQGKAAAFRGYVHMRWRCRQ